VADHAQAALLPDEFPGPVGGRIYAGTCSWAEKSFVKSGFYPPGVRRPEDRLRYYTTQFPTVEIDASYFALLPPAYSRRWAEQTPPGFVMHAKAFGLFTGHAASVQRLPPGFAALLPDRLRESEEVRFSDVPEEFLNACWDHFRAFLDPLALTGKLGYVLFQLPPGVKYSPEALEAMLVQERLIYVMVDLPDLPRLMPAVEAMTDDWAVVRFHGRNRAGWARAGASTEQRYDYDYTADELRPWAEMAGRMAGRSGRFFAMFNNHVRGNMASNARVFQTLVEGREEPGSTP